MRVLVCGGRDFDDEETLFFWLDYIHQVNRISLLIHGGARGADSMAGKWARDRNVTEIVFPAQWSKHGKAAGPIRNKQMLDEGKPDQVVAFPGGRGTQNMIDQASERGVMVWTLGLLGL